MAERRDLLLDALTDYVEQHGLESASVRSLAAAAGVAHNTLTYYFGSRSELMAAIFQRLAQRVATASRISATGDATHSQRLNDVWASMTGPSYASLWPTFFEMLGLALRSPDQHRAFLTHVTDDWTLPLSEELMTDGFAPEEAAASATFVVATIRGLIIDALSGGDPIRIDNAFRMLFDLVASAGYLGTPTQET